METSSRPGPFAPVLTIWVALEIGMLFVERIIRPDLQLMATIAVGGVGTAAFVVGVVAALRKWPWSLLAAAVCLLFGLQFVFAIALAAVIPDPPEEHLVHGYFSILFAFFLGAAANIILSFILAATSYAIARVASKRSHAT